MLTLADIPAAFAAARAEVDAAAPDASTRPPGRCRYCDDSRLITAELQAHARCIVPLAFQRAVYQLWRGSWAATQKCIAEACGVSIAVVGRWLRHVERVERAA